MFYARIERVHYVDNKHTEGESSEGSVFGPFESDNLARDFLNQQSEELHEEFPKAYWSERIDENLELVTSEEGGSPGSRIGVEVESVRFFYGRSAHPDRPDEYWEKSWVSPQRAFE